MKKELIFSLLSYVCLLIAGGAVGLWIYIADDSKPYEQAQQEYLSYFPAAIASGTLLCLIDIVIAGLGIFFITTANTHRTSKTLKSVNTVVAILLGLILFLNVWSLM